MYGPGMENSENEKDAFWECYNECINGFSGNERIVVLGDMNAKVRNREVYRVVGKQGVPGVMGNGEGLVEVCSERRLNTGNAWCQKRLIQKYTREGGNG